MPERPDADETLLRLAQARVATHLLRFPDAVTAAAGLEDEVAALEQLSELVPGPIYRVAPLAYAFAFDADPAALAQTLAERLGGCPAPSVDALPVPPGAEDVPVARRDALALLTLVAPADAGLSAGRRVVIDAAYAARTAELTAARIEEVAADVAARLTEAGQGAEARLARIEAALAASAPDADRLGRIESALAALAAAPAAAPDADRLAGIETALAGLAAAPAADPDPDRLARIETTLAALAADAQAARRAPEAAPDAAPSGEGLSRIDAALAALSAQVEAANSGGDLVHRLSRIEASLAAPDPRLDRIEAALAARDAAPDATLLADLRALADRPAANIDFHHEREGLIRLSSALQTLLSRMDGEITRLIDARGGDAPAGDLGDRLDTLEATLAAASADLAERLDRIEAARAAPEAALLADLRALADRPVANVDFHHEREGLIRLSSALQTLLSRMDGEISRLIDARGADAPAGDLGDRLGALEAALAAAPADLTDRLDRIEAALGGALGAAGDFRADADAVLADLRAVAERPAVNVDFLREREGLVRLSSALQTLLSRMDGAVSRLLDASGTDAATPPDLADRLGRIEGALAETLASAAARDEAADAFRDDAEALLANLRALTERPAANVDFVREREGLVRLSSALQTLLSRMDGEVTRLIDARGAAGEAGAPLEAGVPEDLADRLDRIEAALGAAPAASPDLADRLDRIEAALAGGGAAPADLAERLDAALAARDDAAGAFRAEAEAVLAQMRAVADRPVANVDLNVEREGLARLSVALQVLLTRMDGEVSRLLDARAPAEAAPADLADRLDRIEAALGAPAADPRLDRLAAIEAALAARDGDAAALRGDIEGLLADLRAVAERPVVNVDFRAEREGLGRLSVALQTLLTRMDAEATRMAEAAAAAPVLDRLDALEALLRETRDADPAGDAVAALAGEVRALADRAALPAQDLRRERDSLARLSFALQAAVSRLDGEVSRLIDARLGGGLDGALAERMAALAEAVAPLGESLAQVESTSALTADHSAALVDLVQSVREECAELHGLHGRYFEAIGAVDGARADAGDDLLDRIGATLAEFLARLERIEAQRALPPPAPPAAPPARASLLGARLGRSS